MLHFRTSCLTSERNKEAFAKRPLAFDFYNPANCAFFDSCIAVWWV